MRSIAADPQELALARRWADARFDGVATSKNAKPGLYVVANHDPVLKNSRGGKPLNIAGKTYTRGLYCHAYSKILVRLPGPARSFSALAGVDSNEQTSGGRGSVRFVVLIGESERFRSGLIREGTEATKVAVPLGGSTEFALIIEDGGDGISCDQSDWANATVTLADGRELSLSDLPLNDSDEDLLFAASPPFTFKLAGQPFDPADTKWKTERSSRQLDASRTERVITWSRDGVIVRCVGVHYSDFPVVEWTLYFRNDGQTNSPLLEDIRPLRMEVERGSAGEFLLHHNVGSPADGNDYGPLETTLKPGTSKRLGGAGGRPTNTDWSYFNLEWGDRGIIAAIGWPGQWTAELARDNGRRLRVAAGQETTRFSLLPGEEVRTPLIVLQFWRGDWIHSQNVWRRWMMAHSMPTPGGKLPPPQLLASSSRQYDEMIKANETNQTMFIDRYLAEGLKLDYWWMDAGWYVHHGGGWPRVGTWLVDSNRFPRGLLAVSDHAHNRGVKTLLWFEPERVTPDTWLAKNHPEWILGGSKGGLLNLGNDGARRWLIEHVDRLLTEQGIDLYRQDFNMDPLPFWRANDAPDRQGISEIKHVTGYLAYWDELRRRHPDMLIDSCASGGRRNDIETMRRAVPLWRSDYAYEAIGHQCMTYGISLWLPYHGTGTVATRNASYYGSGATPVEPYAFWSNVAPSLGCGFDMRVKELDYGALRTLVKQWREVAPIFYGDFYPLTPWTRDDKAWIAWQFDQSESGTGTVQVFRRHESFYESARLRLRGLDAKSRYAVSAIGSDIVTDYSGGELMDGGLGIQLKEKPSAKVMMYRRKK